MSRSGKKLNQVPEGSWKLRIRLSFFCRGHSWRSRFWGTGVKVPAVSRVSLEFSRLRVIAFNGLLLTNAICGIVRQRMKYAPENHKSNTGSTVKVDPVTPRR